jgi:hypothetical protein
MENLIIIKIEKIKICFFFEKIFYCLLKFKNNTI